MQRGAHEHVDTDQLAIAAAVVRKYRRDGFVVIDKVLSEEGVDACLEHLRSLEVRIPRLGPIVTVPLERDDFLTRMAVDGRLSGIARSVLEAEPVAFGSTYFVKAPGLGHPVRWHQDAYPWETDLGIVKAVTVWIALDAADEGNGGLQVLPGSQHLPAQPLQATFDGSDVFGLQIAPELVDATMAQTLTMSAGDVCAHHPNLIHGSPANWFIASAASVGYSIPACGRYQKWPEQFGSATNARTPLRVARIG